MPSLRRPLRRGLIQDDIDSHIDAPPRLRFKVKPDIRPTMRFDPQVRLDTTQVTDIRHLPHMPPVPRPPNPNAPKPQPPPPSRPGDMREAMMLDRYRKIAKNLGTELRADDYLPLEEVVRLQFLAKAKGQDFYKLYKQTTGIELWPRRRSY